MTANYVLHENKLTDTPNDYMAKVKPSGTVGFDDVVNRIIEQGSTVVKSDIYSVIEDMNNVIESMILEGNNVNLPMVNYKVSIKGKFEGPDDSYDSTRHEIIAKTSPGPRLRKTVAQRMTLSKMNASIPEPAIQVFINHVTKERNTTITPNGSSELIGYNLKYDQTDPQQGIFFVAEDNTETRVEIFASITSSKIIFTAPSLAPGNYKIKVRALFNNTELRTGELKKATLTIPE